MYPIIEIPADASDMPEVLGTKPKFWYANKTILYKEGRPGSGEHWSEKIACEICALLDLPHAHYDLAHWRGRKGVASPTFVPEGGRLILGNELLARLLQPHYAQGAKRFEAKQHSVRRIMGLLRVNLIQPPVGYQMPAALQSAGDIFAGYLLLDALVGNQDRHHENWGLVITFSAGGAPPAITLAPTFDHASSLGRNERDEERVRRLQTRDRGSALEHYVERAQSAFFQTPTSAKPLSTLAAFQEAAKIAPAAASFWLERLRTLNQNMYYDVVASIPADEMSGPAREFALKMLRLNQERLLRNP